jgi:hypothetical protein
MTGGEGAGVWGWVDVRGCVTSGVVVGLVVVDIWGWVKWDE